MPLLNGEDAPLRREEYLERDTDPFAVFIAKLRDAYQRDDKQFEFDFIQSEDVFSLPEVDPKSSASKGAVWVNLIINRVYEKPGPSFQLNGQSFIDTELDHNFPRRARRWTDGLREFDRWRVAQALRKVRAEQAFYRQSGQAERPSLSERHVCVEAENAATATANLIHPSGPAADSIRRREP
ncbi:hypothetical protein [Hydrogenophaga sp. R2]|uniref:hypothetical protein n=1 Tax=Hydrogenophaga sp. R2 TaxID=3132827 RepID=UPI003CF42468